ncbi:MAG: DUF4339 domain-containing protein [Methylacidiphilales bacterium]|nr:DUF4339 domain-containing protein [Candidatus Methylacidiphilales bacterium]
MKQWYYAKNGQQNGPIDRPILEELYRKGELAPSDLVWEEGMPEWITAGTVFTVTTSGSPSSTLPGDVSSESSALPDYGDFLCWGIALIMIPCLGIGAFITLIVFHILELVAVRKKISEGALARSSYSDIHPALMTLGLICCMAVFYPLFMHLRNESRYFKPQRHAVWFSIVIMVLNIGLALILSMGNIMTQMAAMGHH